MSALLQQLLADNLARVRQRIAAAAERAGRAADDVTLIAVTKYVDVAATQALAAAGCRDLGESRPQSLWTKTEALADLEVRWHLIGHLQRNKIRRTLPHIHLLHSGDSLRLLQAIDEEAAKAGRTAAVLLEVNISGDADKTGFLPEQLVQELQAIGELRHIKIRGLMAMASLQGGRDQARRDFAAARRLRDRLQTECPPNVALEELSLGMSGDLEEAILEGATLVRVGSALFEGWPGFE